ncbi:MAG: TlpA family protein disulfide reductase [Myxococcales bacterium]|nr:TlpA family protein disulfide reductase [Myxococcales bacterium]HQY64349.1 TlpA disulfide reductase family protein [Polyangiaceae bacterium]
MAAPATSPLAPIAQLAFVALAAVGVYSFVSVAREGETRRRCTPTCMLAPTYANANRLAPNFVLKDMAGNSVSLESFRGKVVVLNFWTKTCGPCLQEMPEIADLARIVRQKGDVVVVTVSTDEGPEAVRDTLKAVLREEPPFPVLFDPEAAVVGKKYGTHLFPETWIIDKRGVVRARFDGARDWSSSAIVQLIDQIRVGGYCPIEIEDGKPRGEGARTCESLTGG